jgi:SAM-dependent methyltransferase
VDEQLQQTIRAEEGRHWWFRARREIIAAVLADESGGNPGVIVDLGCGTGGTTEFIARAFPESRVMGVDESAISADACRSRGFEFLRGDACSTPLGDGLADVVTALDVIEHIDDETALVGEAARLLKPEGVLLITVPALPALWGPHDVLNHHQRRYTRQSLRQTLVAGGLTPTRVTYFNMLLLPLAFAVQAAERSSLAKPRRERAPAPPVNGVLYATLSLERPWLASGHDLFAGASLLAVARRGSELCR